VLDPPPTQPPTPAPLQRLTAGHQGRTSQNPPETMAAHHPLGEEEPAGLCGARRASLASACAHASRWAASGATGARRAAPPSSATRAGPGAPRVAGEAAVKAA